MSSLSESRFELDAITADIELTLVSIIQGVALTVLIETSREPIAKLEWMMWPYVLSGLVVILIFWFGFRVVVIFGGWWLGPWRRLDLRQDGWNEAHLVVEELFWWCCCLMKRFRLVPGGGDLPSCWRRRGRCARDVGFVGGLFSCD